MATALRSISFVFAALLALAAAHKATVIVQRNATAEPLMQLTDWRRRHATALLLTAGIVEVLVCVALLLRPAAGFASLGVLAIFYAVNLRRLAATDTCNCFGSALKSPSRRAAIVRNVAIAGVAVPASALYGSSAVAVAPVTQTTLGVALLIAAAIASVDLLRFVPRPQPRPQSVDRSS
jgi:hypothetical protein